MHSFDAAQADLMHIASFGGERGAECAYLLCTYPYRDQSYKETESQIFQLIDQFAAFDTWKHKAFFAAHRCLHRHGRLVPSENHRRKHP